MLAEFVTPNLHVALIHYPLGLLVAGVLVEAFAFLGWRRSPARAAGRWMIGLGAVGGVVAAFSGIYALRAVARSAAETWADVRATSPVLSDGRVWHLLKMHTVYQSSAAAAAMAAVVVWLGCSDRGRRVAHVPVLVVLLASVGGMLTGAWFGGETIYRHGVGVEVAAVVSPPGTPVLAAEKTTPEATDAAPPIPEPTKVEQLFPPVELHVLMAGVVTGLSLLSIGLSIRQVSAAKELADDRRPIRPGNRLPGVDLAYDLTRDPHVPQPASAVAMARSFNPDVEVRVRPRVPAARFWLLACVLAAATSAGGWFVLARSAEIDLTPKHLKSVPAPVVGAGPAAEGGVGQGEPAARPRRQRRGDRRRAGRPGPARPVRPAAADPARRVDGHPARRRLGPGVARRPAAVRRVGRVGHGVQQSRRRAARP